MAEISQKPEILQSENRNLDMYLYIRGLGEAEEITGQIGMEPIESIEPVEETGIHTMILLDNSLSITEENQQKIYEILKRYLEGKNPEEAVSIAVFGEGIEYLVEDEKDVEALLQALEGIEYKNQDSFLTDILYDELRRLESRTGYKRFIIATDGVDNKEIGYTKEELQDRLKESNYPIYSLGCVFKENGEELENLFAISRLTKGEYFLLDEISEFQGVADRLNEQISCIKLQIPEVCCDGSEKSILLSVNVEGAEIELTDNVRMPFVLNENTEGLADGAEAAEPVTEPVEDMLEAVMPTEAEEQQISTGFAEPIAQTSEEPGIDWVTIGAIGCIIVALILLVVLQIKKKGKSEKKLNKKGKQENNKIEIPHDFQKKPGTVPAAPAVVPIADAEDLEDTVSLDVEEDAGTVHLSQEQNYKPKNKYIVVLKDKNNMEKEFRYPIADKVVIGRKRFEDVNIVLGYEQSVSARHCMVSCNNGRFFIEDLGSSNRTYLNNRLVRARTELVSGSSIKLGNLEMTIEFIEMR